MTILGGSGATTTAGDQINGALRLLGVLAEGETPSAAMANDGLTAMQQMLDAWSTERLSVYVTQDQQFTWPAGFATRSVGPSGDFIGNRPINLDDSTYFVDPANGVSYGIQIVNQEQYNSIALKTATSPYPQVCWTNMDMPDMNITVYPVPTKPLLWHIVSVQELSQPPTLATVLVFPPGYLRAFRYGLAIEMAPEYGVEPTNTVQRIAIGSKRDLKSNNSPMDVMAMPVPLINLRGGRFNIWSGQPY